MNTSVVASELKTKDRLIVILPIGSCEQHGLYLPIDTDLRIAQLIADRVIESIDYHGKLILPALSFSSSWEHKGLGTISLNISTMSLILHNIAYSLKQWEIPILLALVNWHGGNSILNSLAAEISSTEGVPTVAIQTMQAATKAWRELFNQDSHDVHAGEIETSIIMKFWPEIIKATTTSMVSFEPEIAPVRIQTAIQSLGFKAITESGIWGNPMNSDSEKGGVIIDIVVKQVKEELIKLLELINTTQKD